MTSHKRMVFALITLLTALTMLWALMRALQVGARAQSGSIGAGPPRIEAPTVSPADLDQTQNVSLTLAAYQAWFGLSTHIQPPPYVSTATAVISEHITAAMAKGIDGFVVDWYGPVAGAPNDQDRGFIDEATAKLLQLAEGRGFYVALMYDEGTVSAAETLTTAFQGRVISDLLYAKRYFTMPAYLQHNGHPALFIFPYEQVDEHIDWGEVRSQLGVSLTLFDKDPDPGDPMHDADFDGFFAWVQPTASQWLTDGTEWGAGYLRWFYNTMATLTYTNKVAVGGVWSGFDDTLASWGTNRYMWRRCGQTWRDTWDIAHEYNPPIVMIDTWNDFEEGTDTEFGVGECLAPSRQKAAFPGQQVLYLHTITNTAKFTDTFSITARSSRAWPFSMDPLSVTLVGHAGVNLTLALSVPETAAAGQIDWLAITATSGLSAAVHSSVMDTTTVYPVVSITDVTSTTAHISWQTDPATSSDLYLDSDIVSIFPAPRPTSHALQGMAYAPGEYDNYLDCVDRALVTDTIARDVEAIDDADFNTIVLYPTGPLAGEFHPWDEIVFNAAISQALKIAFRLEWYPSSFDWEPESCDAVLDHYGAYLSYFETNPDLLLYLLINMPLDDPTVPPATIVQQRRYVGYCYNKIKQEVPGAQVYANTYYGWRDDLHQAPVGDLVDGVSVVVYSQHADGAPFDCHVIPTADHPASTLICKDQFDYYLDKAWRENRLETLGKPFVLDATGFAPAASYADPDQKNSVVADSWAKVRAIDALRRYLEQDTRLYGWSYFKLLHKDEAAWGLIDRRCLSDPVVAITHQLTLTDLFPATAYSLTLQASDVMSGVYSFTTLAPPTQANVPPLMTLKGPPYGHELTPDEGALAITWQDDDPDDNAYIRLYYDIDDAGCDGTMIVDGLSENETNDIFTWTLPTVLPTGSYYVYSQIEDSTNPVECDYSSGQFVPSAETLKVMPSLGPITVDGVMNELMWRFAVPHTYAVHSSQTDVTTATMRALWDWDYFYVGFEVDDTQVETATLDWNGDSVSIIFNNGEFKCRQDVGGTGEGEGDRALYLPSCTTLNDAGDTDCGYTVEMRIQWSKAHITANAGDVLPIDLLSVDHDGNPGAPYDDPGTEFSKLSWDGDGSVDTTGRSLLLLPSVAFGGASYSVGEGAGPAVVTVTLSGATALTAAVDYAASDGTATAGADYTSVSSTLVFSPGTTVLTFTVPIADDALEEDDETITLTLRSPTNAALGASDSATLTILNDDYYHIYLPVVLERWPPIPDVPVLNSISNPDGDGNYTVSWNAAYPSDNRGSDWQVGILDDRPLQP